MTARALPHTLITFDVDGTLVKGSGQLAEASAHARAFAHAVGVVFGDGTPTEIPAKILPPEGYHGSTDGLISLRLARAALGVEPAVSAPRLTEVFSVMYAFIAEMDDADVARAIEPLPGALATLERLALRDDVVCGLVTGNVEAIARKKMRATGLYATGGLAPPTPSQTGGFGEHEWGFLGGFGSDYCSCDIDDLERNYLDRAEQIAIAWRRAKGEYASLTRVIHVGDAPADVLAARAVGEGRVSIGEGVTVGCVGVATGSFSAEHLRGCLGEPRPGQWEPIVLARGLEEDFIGAIGL